ncbi:MAG: hypothetical protein J5588_07885 [Bacteroidales bacterium]|mgnify:CR=1 FL=1|jgi:hypothetical protein|nr:hypothetical protein [Bacteroidales bacterium]MBP5583851.1 hypothetical protein [Bacteroidales bacterium]
MEKTEKQRKDELFKLILKKSGMTYAEFLTAVKHNYVARNLDTLTATERKKFNVCAQ